MSRPGNDLPQAALEALERGDIQDALDQFERAVQIDGENLSLRADYGFLLWRTYEFERGEKVFADLCTDSRTGVPTLQAMAKLLFNSGRFSQAAATMKIAIARVDPADNQSLELYASTLERDNQLLQAREHAERALLVNPASGPATRLLAHIEKRQGEFDRAAARLQYHLERFPSDWDWGLRYELAASLDRLGEYDEAWRQLGLAKAQLAPQSAPHLQHSYFIRKRQWELSREITDADLSRWHRAADQLPPLRMAILAGFPRSGTTLLEQIIATHDDCIDTDETGILATQFTAPLVWQAATAADALIEIRSLDRDSLLAGRTSYGKFTESFLGEPVGNRLLIEKEPLLTPDLALPLRLFPEARLLMPLRDPRDVIVSYYFTMVPLNWNSAPSTSILEAARFYFDCMRHWIILRDRLPGAWQESRYEDIVTQPAETMRQIFEFLGLTWADALLDEKLRSERKAARTPTYDDITKPIYTRAVGRWRNYEKFLEPCQTTLQPFLEAWGYSAFP